MKKKIVSVLLCATMVTGLAMGCGKSSDSSSEKTSDGKTKIRMTYWNNEDTVKTLLDYLEKEVPEVSFIKPMGAFYLFVDISSVKDALLATADADGRMPQSGTDSYAMEFTMKLLNEKHVAIAPGTAFGKEGYIRIAYATDKETLLEGLARIRDLVKELLA